MRRSAKTVLLILTISLLCQVVLAKDNFTNNGDTIYYLSGDIIRMITLPDNKSATIVFEAPKETASESYQINGLSCGPNKTLAFNLVHSFKKVADYSKPIYRVTIESYSLVSKKLQTLVDEDETSVDFPSLSYDGTFLSMSASDTKHEGFYFLIKNLKTGANKQYDQFKASNKLRALSPDNKLLAITGVDSRTKRTRTYFLDLDTAKLSPWIEGMTPIFSPNGKLIAYTTSNQKEIMISDRTGKRIQSYDGYFVKDLNGWIDNNRIVFTIGHFMHTNHIGILDIQKKRIYDIEVPTSGEISGICYRPLITVKTTD